MQDLTVTLVQPDLAWQDPPANRAHLDALIASLPSPGDLVVLPEMFATGFTMAPQTHAETMAGASVAWLAAVARRHATTVCGSLVIEDADRYFNRFIWMPPDGEPAWYDKRHLFRMAGEHRHYAAGSERRVFVLKSWRVCPLVCYDLRFPVWSRGANAFDLQLFVANWPAARHSAWRTLLPARAVENQCYSVGVNRVGTDGNGVAYAGGSMVCDYLGNILQEAGGDEAVVRVQLPGAALESYRERFPAWRDADPFRINP